MASERAYENRAVVDDDQLAHQVVRELMDAPGIVQVQKWRPDPDEVSAVSDREVNMYGGLARKPGVRGGGSSA
jgi:S-adenosyl methyltransferase